MGSPVTSAQWSHIITLLGGFFIEHWWNGRSNWEQVIQSSIGQAGQQAASICARECTSKDIETFECPPPQSFSLHLGLSLTFLLASCVGWIIIVWRGCWTREKSEVRKEPRIDRDQSPSNIEDLRNLAQLQLAELRVRSRRNGTP